MDSEKAFDMLPYVADVYEKLNIQEFAKENMVNPAGMSQEQKEKAKMDSGQKLITYVLKNSAQVKEEFFGIVAIASDITLEEAKKRSIAETAKAFKEVFSDKELMDFFKSAVQ